jgi:hypothetical protein
MKILFILITTFYFISPSFGQQKTSAKYNTTSVKTQTSTPSLEETLKWLEEKIEKYYTIGDKSNRILAVTFTWDDEYNCDISEYYSQLQESFQPTGNGYDGRKITSNLVSTWEFNLRDLDPNNMSYSDEQNNEQFQISSKENSKTIKWTVTYHYFCDYFDTDVHQRIVLWNQDKEEHDNMNFLKIFIYSGESNLIERFKKAWKNAIAKCPKISSTEKF